MFTVCFVPLLPGPPPPHAELPSSPTRGLLPGSPVGPRCVGRSRRPQSSARHICAEKRALHGAAAQRVFTK